MYLDQRDGGKLVEKLVFVEVKILHDQSLIQEQRGYRNSLKFDFFSSTHKLIHKL